jgi:plasmid stability protein
MLSGGPEQPPGSERMAHLVLHDVDPKVIEELRRRGDPHSRSIEDEAKIVLEEFLGLSRARALHAAQRIRAELAGPLSDSAEWLRQERRGERSR